MNMIIIYQQEFNGTKFLLNILSSAGNIDLVNENSKIRKHSLVGDIC